MQEELAPAKINLALAITGRRVDGYHNIDTVMHSITLSDSVFFSPADELIFRCNDLALPLGAGNLAWEAAQLVRRYVGQRRGVAIQLNKRIPAGSGLGGGCSDTAAVLRGLNRFWQLGLTDAELLWLAGRLGSDVPFCVFGGCARGREKGDVLTPLPELPETNLVIVMPPLSVASAQAYAKYDTTSFAGTVDVTGVVAALGQRPEMVWRRLGNDFLALLAPLEPKLQELSKFLRDLRYPYSLTGSGAAFFVAVPTAREAHFVMRQIEREQRGWRSYQVKTRGGYR